MKRTLLALACGVALLACGAQVQAGTISYQIPCLYLEGGTAAGSVDLVEGTGNCFVGMWKRPGLIGSVLGSVEDFQSEFGLEGDAGVHTILRVCVPDLLADGITTDTFKSANLEFYLEREDTSANTITVTSFMADGGLGFYYDDEDLGSKRVGFDEIGLAAGDDGTYSLDVTSLLQPWLASSSSNWFGLHLAGSRLGDLTKIPTTNLFAGHVQLIVNTEELSPVPEPGTVVGLLGMGAVGLIGVAIRRRRAG